ncbi:maleylpyruvate isomerase family mycothiol-dependent enzyme [Actinomadura sp. WMMB 499]|uniref:maleylpyruvate isomerase family mycothiol-dependent enzyme n=1 Tax=Actinomadura sp. WMMB 499 TaxID=1219491 RepID=UPI00159E336E|nr:maleylpyruvate isomerase family mycothiol-dependent enzyme [Actinomadura sp. WMMB 499]
MTETAASAFDHARYCDALELEIAAFADAAGRIDPDEPVPTCPGWSAAELVRHLGGVQRWAAGTVRTLTTRRLSLRELGVTFPVARVDHVPWLLEGGELLLRVLRAADPDAGVWAWGADQHVRFWSRRLLHETVVHRCDLDIAAGGAPEAAPEVAADGIAEYFANLESAAAFSPRIVNLRGNGETLDFVAGDIGARWRFRLLPDGFEISGGAGEAGAAGDAGDADATVRGDASDVFLFLWGRRKPGDPRLEFSGAEDVLVRWAENSAIG